ncbi:DMT family transporter [Rhizobium sp. BK456]|uniref:DMT family transporter n=1 Tax=Rhizobium sp. BK456 TaxID=2587007 RepID=UPI001608B9B0|nr:DMT family transporter [Rhizobium sp. BK456]MBB3522217.1 drug/metabolite transporter (DMT)-like permease [Rhizobium sp. BK456]
MTGLCYALTVLIWGTTWIAIKNQLGVVPIEASIAYRFALAGVILFVGLTVAKRLQPIPLRHHPYVVLQSICLFSCNFLCFYIAETLVPSGIVSVIFSAATIFNLANGMVAFGQRPSARILLGAAFGVAGIVCLFWNEAAAAAFDRNVVIGVMLALLGTWFFSVGNLVSVRNRKHGLSVTSVNAYGMLYGAGIVSAFAAIRGVEFTFDPSASYVDSLLYLAIFGSVIGFTTYLTVVNRLGAAKAAYMTVLFPIVALTISVFFEGYQLGPLAALGLCAVLVGNVLVFSPVPRLAVFTRRFRL